MPLDLPLFPACRNRKDARPVPVRRIATSPIPLDRAAPRAPNRRFEREPRDGRGETRPSEKGLLLSARACEPASPRNHLRLSDSSFVNKVRHWSVKNKCPSLASRAFNFAVFADCRRRLKLWQHPRLEVAQLPQTLFHQPL